MKLYRSEDGEWVLKGDRELLSKLTGLLAVSRDGSRPSREQSEFADRLHTYLWGWNKLHNQGRRDLTEERIEIRGEMVGRLNGTRFDDFSDIPGRSDPSCYYCGVRLAGRPRHRINLGTEEDPDYDLVCGECREMKEE